MNVNNEIARRLEEVASILEVQGANTYRVDAYRRAASTVRSLREPLSALLERRGLEGLLELPGIGDRLALTIRDMLLSGRFPMLEHLRGEVDVEDLLQSVPGIGPTQARRLHHDLAIDTLEDLEAAAHDGRLSVAGFGPKRISGIADSLATRLGRVRRPVPPPGGEPSVEELLDVDREYREASAAGYVTRIAPRRFNPTAEAWLPILHTHRGDRHYTALFSNTARAHELGRTHDWVILYQDEGHQYTIVTGHSGPLLGRRIVRGREPECQDYYSRMVTACPEDHPALV